MTATPRIQAVERTFTNLAAAVAKTVDYRRFRYSATINGEKTPKRRAESFNDFQTAILKLGFEAERGDRISVWLPGPVGSTHLYMF